jgi:hypothetical protein
LDTAQVLPDLTCGAYACVCVFDARVWRKPRSTRAPGSTALVMSFTPSNNFLIGSLRVIDKANPRIRSLEPAKPEIRQLFRFSELLSVPINLRRTLYD